MSNSSELNLNKIAADVAAKLVEKTLSSLSSSVSSALKTTSVALRIGFESYFQNILRRTSTVKTLIHPDSRISIFDIYVPLEFDFDGTKSSEESLVSKIGSGHHVLVMGTAGSGKSMFAKHLTSSMLVNLDERVPIFFELRSLNDGAHESIEAAILSSITTDVQSMSLATLRSLLKSGKAFLVLDGYDEIDFAIRDRVGKSISMFCDEYRKSPIVVTSRPDDRLASIPGLDVYRARPMTKDQSISLISRIEYDSEIKSAFTNAVNSHLYDRHAEFMSNPLLASMMLLTYSYYSNLPDKIHIFYQQAFETLAQRHDRSKGVYTRRSHTDLPIDQFQDIVCHFSTVSYSEQKFSFSKVDLLSRISDSISFYGVKCPSEAFLLDLVESTCLMHLDGIEYCFAHRSFQEYFAARFISKLDTETASLLIPPLVERCVTDNALFLLYDLNQPLVERSWSQGAIRTLIDSYESNTHLSAKSLSSLFYTTVVIDFEYLGPTIDSGNELCVNAYAVGRMYEINPWPMQRSEISQRNSAIATYFNTHPREMELAKTNSGTPPEQFEKFLSDQSKRWMVIFLEMVYIESDLVSLTGIPDRLKIEYDSWKSVANDIEGRISKHRNLGLALSRKQ